MATVMALAIAGACTLKDQSAPSLVGPSELGLSINLTAQPDSLPRDGASQTRVEIWARDENGRPKVNLSLRLTLECYTSGGRQAADFGTLSARTVPTGSDGKAVVNYTAPPDISPLDQFCMYNMVWVTATPILDNYANQVPREVEIRLVPTGPIVPPSNLSPSFTFEPTSPAEGDGVAFDATGSTGAIASYSWTFGDGTTGTGAVTTHTYTQAGSYAVTLTVADAVGRAVSTTQIVTVEAGPGPVASFNYSPTSVSVNQPVYFNASNSTAPAGRTIVGYSWEFGDGTGASGQFPTHIYTAAASYVVSLTVTDSFGKTATTSSTISIAAAAGLTADFSVSPTTGSVGQTIVFNASDSKAASGRTIVSYVWDYGNGGSATLTTPLGANTTYAAAGTYTVTLLITDDQGNTDSKSATVTIS